MGISTNLHICGLMYTGIFFKKLKILLVWLPQALVAAGGIF